MGQLVLLWLGSIIFLQDFRKTHIVSSAISTSPHFHWFLLNNVANISENGGSHDNHAYNACKNQGVSGLNIASIVGRLLGDLKENCSCSMGY